MRICALGDLNKNVLIFMQCLESKEIDVLENIFYRQVHASDSHNGRIFRCLVEDMASNACTIGSSVVEFRGHDLCNLSESFAHFRDFLVQIDNVLFEIIDFKLEDLNWIKRHSVEAV